MCVKNGGSAWLNHPAFISPPDEAHLRCSTPFQGKVSCLNPRFVPHFMFSDHRPSHTSHAETHEHTYRHISASSHAGKSSLCAGGAQGEGDCGCRGALFRSGTVVYSGGWVILASTVYYDGNYDDFHNTEPNSSFYTPVTTTSRQTSIIYK